MADTFIQNDSLIVNSLYLYCIYSTSPRHESKKCICAASVNHENSLLAFTIKEEVNGETIYGSFVAEIQPQSRVFTLNLEGLHFRKLQFIQTDFSAQRTRHSRQQYTLSRLLVVIPDTFGALYTFKAQVTRKGYSLVEEPEQEALCKNFSWYQWDPAMQWLYYAQFESSTSIVQSSLSGRNSLVLHCYSLAQVQPQLLLTIVLPLPYWEQYYLRAETYLHSPLALALPVREMNMQVLYNHRGLWCVCLQHTSGEKENIDLGDESDQEKQDIPEGGKLDYTVYIVHNGHMLYMQVPLPMPVVEPLNIHFMLLGSFVVAYIPKFMLHFLNVGPDTDPCHHLAFSPSHTPEFPAPQYPGDSVGSGGPLLSSAVTASLPSQNTTTVIDCTASTLYETSINTAAFLQLFKTTDSIEMMEDLLHMMIVSLRHHGMALAMMEHVCQSPMRLGDHRLFAEILVSFAFANTAFACKRYIAKQLPLTMTPTFLGRVFKSSERVTFAMLRLNPMRNFIKQLLVQSDQRLVDISAEELLSHEVGDAPFEMLCYIAVTSQPSPTRINILQEIESSDKSSALASRPLPPSPSSTKKRSKKSRKLESSTDPTLNRSTILNRLSMLTRSSFQIRAGGPTNQPDSSPSNLVKFLVPDEDQEKALQDEREMVAGVIMKVVSRGLPPRARSLVFTTVRAYCAELEKHSCSMLQFIWDSLGFNNDIHPVVHPIYRQPTALEEILFELLEAYHLAHQEVGFPTPSGFHTLFATLGFICLSDTLFLQYLRNGVFMPTKRFVELLLKGLQQEREHVVYEVFCHAEQQLATWAFQQWKHPTIDTLMGHTAEVVDTNM